MGENFKPLEPPDSFCLLAAEGWLELGNPGEAEAELQRLTPAVRAHPCVLDVRWKICAKTEKWEPALEIARALIEMLPENPLGFIDYAYSLHEMKRTQEAWGVLMPVADKFPDATIPYNLACYCCQLGNLRAAMRWLEKAVALTGRKEIRRMALADQDLKPLWSRISEF